MHRAVARVCSRQGLVSTICVWTAVLSTVFPGLAQTSPPSEPDDLSTFTVTRLDGGPFDAGELAGRAVLIDFWAVWCAPCIAAFPQLSRLHDDLGGSGFQVLGVAVYSGSREDVAEFLVDHPVTYPMVVGDESLTERFGVIGFPTYFLIAPNGSVYRQYVGEMPDLYDTVAADLDLLRRQPPAEAGSGINLEKEDS